MARHNNKKKALSNLQKFSANPAMLPQVFSKRVKKCPLNEAGVIVDYKNVALIKQYLSERGKILPRRITAVCSKKQRELATAIKRARAIALLPYVSN
jgi:small subunit ribosomal protein S18